VLGRGGMGEVILARDPQFGREVALKRMRADAPVGDHAERFVREARIQARLDHPSILPVHELGYDGDGRPYFTMKRLVGVTLATLIADPTTPQRRLLGAFVDVCFAIELAHTRGVIHRDLKPSNVMLGDFNDVYVLDWGVAKVLGIDEPIAPPLYEHEEGGTATGAMLGTPGYMAPEQMRGDPVTTAVDVYSLGALLFEILARAPLHPRGEAAIASTLAPPSVSPAQRLGDDSISPELDAACVAALAESPADRPKARELAGLVQRYLDGDRDVERRQRLAAEALDLAHAAISSGDPTRRSEAVRAAGRAIALDPESDAAAEVFASLIAQPPATNPPELEAELAAEDIEGVRRRSRRAVLAFLGIYGLLVLVPFVHVADWAELIAVLGGTTMMALISLVNSRTGRVPLSIFLSAAGLLVLVMSRLAGPALLTPLLAVGIALSQASRRRLLAHRWAIYAWTAIVLTIPVVLEITGVLTRTSRMGPEGLVLTGRVFDSHNRYDEAGLMIGSIVLALTVVAYATGLAADRYYAQRRLHVQAWHLRQLLPSHRRPDTITI
jgi:hypothetical protein